MRNWSQTVTQKSNALDLEEGVLRGAIIKKLPKVSKDQQRIVIEEKQLRFNRQ